MISAIALMAFGFANAQTDVKFGAKGGINFSTLTGDTEGASSRIGFTIGGFAEFKLSDKFVVQPEVLYSGQGASYSYSESGPGYAFVEEGDVNLGYILVPVMAKYYVIDNLSLEFGPQVGFLIAANQKGDYVETYEGVTFAQSFDEDIKDEINSVDFGLNFGAGYDFTDNMTAGLRYNLGISNVYKTSEGSDYESKNSVFSLTFGYKF